jgi:3-methyladenine DNA glycosylase AlkC
MAELIKDLFKVEFISEFGENLAKTINFDNTKFLNEVFSDDWQIMEFKQRMRHISTCLANNLPTDYSQNIDAIIKVLIKMNREEDTFSFPFIFVPDYVQEHGINDFDKSMQSIEIITQYISCEFAIRPFIIQYEEATMKQMQSWAKHLNWSVRRLASEGCRPRLPWAMSLPKYKKDPTPILPILKMLRDDEHENVRNSVANNLNDISKEHPELILELLKEWFIDTPERLKLIKHAARTLLKKGNPKAMELFGFANPESIHISDITIPNSVDIGNNMEFAFTLKNTADTAKKVRIEYAIYFLKSNNEHSKKVFKISEKQYSGLEDRIIQKKTLFPYNHNTKILSRYPLPIHNN